MFALLKPTFSLPLRPQKLPLMLHPRAERSPTDFDIHVAYNLVTPLAKQNTSASEIQNLTASAGRLVPFIFGARTLHQ